LGNLIENTPNIKTYHIDKLQLFVDVVKILFPLTEQEILERVIEILEYLLKNKDIKKIPLLHRMVFCSHLAVKDVSTNFFSPNAETNSKEQYSRNDCKASCIKNSYSLVSFLFYIIKVISDYNINVFRFKTKNRRTRITRE
jgi:hypothetical protein